MREILPWAVQYRDMSLRGFSNEIDITYTIGSLTVLRLAGTTDVWRANGRFSYTEIDVSLDNWVNGVVGVWRICE